MRTNAKNTTKKVKAVLTLEECIGEAQKYQTRADFYNGSRVAYQTARDNGWLREVLSRLMCTQTNPSILAKTKKVKAVLTLEGCIGEAQKYQSRADFYNGSRAAYQTAKDNGWLPEVLSNLKDTSTTTKFRKELTLEECIIEAKKYHTSTELRRGSWPAFRSARDNGWLPEVRRFLISMSLKRLAHL
jgi:hypothetical protein